MTFSTRILCIFFVMTISLVTACQGQIISTPASPALVENFCPTPLPAPGTSPIWSGEHRTWVAGSPTRPLIKVVLTHPSAVCNDGSQAVMFVRRASASWGGQDNQLSDAYHIHFKGGGSCKKFEDCANRWCNAPGTRIFDKPGQMSSRGYVDAIEGEGLFMDHPSNQFAAANQVMLGYCSSDGWIGSAPAGTAVSIDPDDDPAYVSKIAFMGEHITQAAFNALDSGVWAGGVVDAPSYQMPPLTLANHILISGDSAGASGVRSHLDRIAARYSDADVVSILDAGASIDMQDPRISYTSLTATPSYNQMMDLATEQARQFHSVNDTALDVSCKTANPGIGANDRPCFDQYRLQRFHITTPTMQRTSQRDTATATKLLTMLAPPANQNMAIISRDGMLAAASTRPTLSVLSPNCGRHVTFRTTNQIRNMEVLAPGPTLYTDLRDWALPCLAGACPVQVRKLANPAPTGPPAPSDCP